MPSIQPILSDEYREYLKELFVFTPLNFSFRNPEDLIVKLSHISDRKSVIAKSKGKYFSEGINVNIRDYTNGWFTLYDKNEDVIESYAKTKFVQVSHISHETRFMNFIFFKDYVNITGCDPFIPIAEFSDYNFGCFDKPTTKSAFDRKKNEVNERRILLKNTINLFGSKYVYYIHNKNEKAMELLFNSHITRQEKLEQLKGFNILPFSFRTLQKIDLSNSENIIFHDKLVIRK